MLAGINCQNKETVFLKHAWKIASIAIILIIFSYFFLDQRLAFYFHSMSFCLHSFFQMITDICEPALHVLLWPSIAFFILYVLKKTRIGNRALAIAFSVSLANTLIIPVKCFFGRTRPELLFSKGLFDFEFFAAHNVDLSFPSGHAVTIFAIVSMLACFYPKFTWAFVLIGFLLSFIRVIVTAHYLSDVIGGALLGMFVAQFVYSAMKQAKVSFAKP